MSQPIGGYGMDGLPKNVMNEYSKAAIEKWVHGHADWTKMTMRNIARAPFDALVLTDDELKALLERMATANGVPVPTENLAVDAFTAFYGIPVRTKRTRLGCAFVALMLAQEGKRVMLGDGTVVG